jgi:electron transfer flavoprotein alpha subunit
MKAFVIAEHVDSIKELAAGARIMADEVVAIPLGDILVPPNTADVVINILTPNDFAFEDAADTIATLIPEKAVILVEPTRRLKIVAGKVAAYWSTSVVTNVFAFRPEGAVSLYYGGLAERVRIPKSDVAIYTVVPGTFADVQAFGANMTKDVPLVAPACPIEVLSEESIEKSSINLHAAEIIVAVGRGFANKEDLNMAHQLCKSLNAGLGCSRPLTEGLDWLPKETYIGVSGLTLSPKIYICIGISGQMQHMVGCNRSDIIFAINKDKNAAVFNQCDYGLVGDLKTIIPAILSAL